MDLQERTVDRDVSGQQVTPRWKLQAKLFGPDGNMLADFTGSNALYFPDCLAGIQRELADDILDSIANRVMAARAGIEV